MKKLTKLLKEYRADFGGTLPQNTLFGLYDLIKYVQKELGKKDLNVIEIGTFEGVSTELFAMTCGEVITVDGWDLSVEWNDYDGIPKERLIQAETVCREKLKNYPNVTIIKDISINAYKKFEDGKYDLIYIDGDHKEKAVNDDIIYWKSKVKSGGFIGGHDYTNIYMVRNAVNNIFGEPDKIFKDCSWLKKCI